MGGWKGSDRRTIDCHFHWLPRPFFESYCRRASGPRAERTERGYRLFWNPNGEALSAETPSPVWFDLEEELAYLDGLRSGMGAICSLGPFADYFSYLPPAEGREAAMLWNELMAEAQQQYPGRFWAMAAVSLADPDVAIETVEHAINRLGLVGVSLPSSVGRDGRIDAEHLEPFYRRVEELGVPVMVHPNDSVFPEILSGYNGAMYLSLGRVVDVSVAAYRLVLSGIMERYPGLKVYVSHTIGALPYQAGRLDKNSGAAGLPRPPSEYVRRMFTDTVSPHAPGVKFALDYFPAKHVMYGSDYPCWDPARALQILDEIDLTEEERESLLGKNAAEFFGITARAATGLP